jgi:hypothetical protein
VAIELKVTVQVPSNDVFFFLWFCLIEVRHMSTNALQLGPNLLGLIQYVDTLVIGTCI